MKHKLFALILLAIPALASAETIGQIDLIGGNSEPILRFGTLSKPSYYGVAVLINKKQEQFVPFSMIRLITKEPLNYKVIAVNGGAYYTKSNYPFFEQVPGARELVPVMTDSNTHGFHYITYDKATGKYRQEAIPTSIISKLQLMDSK
jgi:hypothetical protein